MWTPNKLDKTDLIGLLLIGLCFIWYRILIPMLIVCQSYWANVAAFAMFIIPVIVMFAFVVNCVFNKWFGDQCK